MSSDRISSNNPSGTIAGGSLQENVGKGVRKKRNTDKKLPERYESEPKVKDLTRRATDELKTAFSEGLKKLSLKPVYDWSAEHNIKPSKIKQLLILHGLIKAAAKSASRLIPIEKRKVTDPGFLNFVKAAEKQVIKSNPQIKALLKEKKKKQKITRADRKYKRKFGHDDSEDIGETAAASTGESTFGSVDRKANETSGLDSTKANRVIGPADVQKSKG